MLTFITAILTNLIICYLISRYYERYIRQYQAVWLKQRQVILFQFQRIEELEIERETLHQAAVEALADLPRIEERYEAGGMGIVTWRN